MRANSRAVCDVAHPAPATAAMGMPLPLALPRLCATGPWASVTACPRRCTCCSTTRWMETRQSALCVEVVHWQCASVSTCFVCIRCLNGDVVIEPTCISSCLGVCERMLCTCECLKTEASCSRGRGGGLRAAACQTETPSSIKAPHSKGVPPLTRAPSRLPWPPYTHNLSLACSLMVWSCVHGVLSLQDWSSSGLSMDLYCQTPNTLGQPQQRGATPRPGAVPTSLGPHAPTTYHLHVH
jgi:hypothetical protein